MRNHPDLEKWGNGGFAKYSIGNLHSLQIATFLNNAQSSRFGKSGEMEGLQNTL
jgi:hypothetical protein